MTDRETLDPVGLAAALEAKLRKAADEMRAENQKGWPVLCDMVADYLSTTGAPEAVAWQIEQGPQKQDRDAFKAGWWTNAAYDQPASYLEGCEEVDWLEYQDKGLDGYVSDLLQADRDNRDAEEFTPAAPLPAATAVGVKGVTDEMERIETYFARQIEWSRQTFGPSLRTKGVLDHIGKELREIAADPHDLSEWIDVVILAMDGFWRHGGAATDLMPRLLAKQQKNMARSWPDWRAMSEDRAIEHDRSGEASLAALPALPGGAGVKKLEWSEEEEGWWGAVPMVGCRPYEVRVTDRGAVRVRSPENGGWSPFEGTAEEAKAVFQKHFERRILSTLTQVADTGGNVPVGWRDMADAPKDGTRFLINTVTFGWSSDICQNVATGEKAVEGWWAKDLSGEDKWLEWCGNEKIRTTDSITPLGWMPLPSAPHSVGDR